ncbi:hypothetical protein, partial [Nocardia farcinica]|uniref:hypothetical protein n=1 Tax=Nocardia farcinica TaxID=37329 RepID=UPI001C0EBB76
DRRYNVEFVLLTGGGCVSSVVQNPINHLPAVLGPTPLERLGIDGAAAEVPSVVHHENAGPDLLSNWYTVRHRNTIVCHLT